MIFNLFLARLTYRLLEKGGFRSGLPSLCERVRPSSELRSSDAGEKKMQFILSRYGVMF